MPRSVKSNDPDAERKTSLQPLALSYLLTAAGGDAQRIDEQIIVASASQLDAYLADEAHHAAIKVKDPVTKQETGEIRYQRRPLAVSAPADPVLLMHVLTRAAQSPGALVGDKLTSGAFSRAVRLPLLATYVGWSVDEINKYELDRAEEISTARAERMRGTHGQASAAYQKLKKTADTFKRLREMMEASGEPLKPEMVALFASLDDGDDDDEAA